MGNADTKLNFRKAVVQLTSKTHVSCGQNFCLCHMNKAIFVAVNGDSYAIIVVTFVAWLQFLVVTFAMKPFNVSVTFKSLNVVNVQHMFPSSVQFKNDEFKYCVVK
jgi:uncharacterized protein YqhQ